MYGEVKEKYNKFREKYGVDIKYHRYRDNLNYGLSDEQIYDKITKVTIDKSYCNYIKKYGEGYTRQHYKNLKRKGLSDEDIQKQYLNKLYFNAYKIMYKEYIQTYIFGFSKQVYMKYIYKGYTDYQINQEYIKKPTNNEEGLTTSDLQYILENKHYDSSI